jgi:hypothetical protein
MNAVLTSQNDSADPSPWRSGKTVAEGRPTDGNLHTGWDGARVASWSHPTRPKASGTAKTPSSGLTATFSLCKGEKGRSEAGGCS